MELNYLRISVPSGHMHGGDQALFGKKVSRSGCGMIAVCDYILYSHGKRNISFEEYSEFVSRFRDEEAYLHSANLLGISPKKAVKLINAHVKAPGVTFISHSEFSPGSLKNFIYDSVSEGLPVIVRIGLNGNKLPYRMQYPGKGGSMGHGSTGWHYITVTGITGQGKVIFSSWGGKGETDIGMLFRHFGLTGGVIADKRITVPPK